MMSHRNRPGAVRPQGGTGDAVFGLWAAFLYARDVCTTWSRKRRDTRLLEALDDRMLKDIGLNRGHILSAIHGRFHRE